MNKLLKDVTHLRASKNGKKKGKMGDLGKSKISSSSNGK